MCIENEGQPYTTDNSFRARAEAQQRRYRASVLQAPWAKYGHLLADSAMTDGSNFILPVCADAARARMKAGKGVAFERTFGNMLSSQAMCFNLFAPLAQPWGAETAAKALRAFVPAISTVESICIEHTPAPDVFGDQSGMSGVDCDVLVEFADAEGNKGVLVVETKFVEPEFSTCGIRRRASSDTCPEDVRLAPDGSACGYSKKGYAYWQRTLERSSLRGEVIERAGCPFGGPLWQMWVNHALAHEEAHRRGARHAVFAVCAPRENTALLGESRSLIDAFRELVRVPESVVFIPVEDLIARLREHDDFPDAERWTTGLTARYIVA